MKNKKRLKKEFRPKKFLLILGTIVIILSLFGGIILSYFVSKEEAQDITTINENGKYAKVNVDLVTNYFATLETNNSIEKYYFITSNDKLYIAKLTEEVFNSLKAHYDYNYNTDTDAIAPDFLTIYGYTESIPDEIKTFAIEYFKESEGIDIALEDFEDLVYPYIIDTYKTKTATITGIITISGIITVIGLIIVFLYVGNTSKTRKCLKNYKDKILDIGEELAKDTTFHSEICKVYITDNYLISYKDNLLIICLKDIVWIYPFEYHSKGIITQKSICVITKDKAKNKIGNITSWQKGTEMPYNELYQKLLQKTPDALHGYSNNNKEKMKKYITK